MKPKQNLVGQIAILIVILVAALAVLVLRPFSSHNAPVPSAQRMNTTFNTQALQTVDGRDNNYPPVTFTDLGKSNPFQ